MPKDGFTSSPDALHHRAKLINLGNRNLVCCLAFYILYAKATCINFSARGVYGISNLHFFKFLNSHMSATNRSVIEIWYAGGCIGL